VCLLSPQCTRRHRPTACEKLRKLSLQHRQSVITAKELCVYCLRHSYLDTVRMRECTKRNTQAHWLSNEARDWSTPPRVDRELPPVEPKVGRVAYDCASIRVKTASDLRADSYSAQPVTLFDTSGRCRLSPWTQPYRTVPEVEVMLGRGKREATYRLFMLEVRPHRTTLTL
jgi:hypothetical protein